MYTNMYMYIDSYVDDDDGWEENEKGEDQREYTNYTMEMANLGLNLVKYMASTRTKYVHVHMHVHTSSMFKGIGVVPRHLYRQAAFP
jgi:hypothetical protein